MVMYFILATLPALHLPSGDLLPSSSISNFITKEKASPSTSSSSAAAKASSTSQQHEDDEEEHEPSDKSIIEQNAQVQTRTYTSLVEAKLQPALVSVLLLEQIGACMQEYTRDRKLMHAMCVIYVAITSLPQPTRIFQSHNPLIFPTNTKSRNSSTPTFSSPDTLRPRSLH